MFKDSTGPFGVISLGGYFSTEPDVVIEMIAYKSNGDMLSSVTIGDMGTSWHNQYVEIISAAGDICIVKFRPITENALRHFCMDDLTITPVPEPSSLAVLAFGLAPLGFAGLRRIRR